MVKRFDMALDYTYCYEDGDTPSIRSEPSDDGGWVRYEDYAKLLVTTVWVLRVSERESEYLVGVHSTRERAEAEAATFTDPSWHTDITEMVVDQTGTDWRQP